MVGCCQSRGGRGTGLDLSREMDETCSSCSETIGQKKDESQFVPFHFISFKQSKAAWWLKRCVSFYFGGFGELALTA